MNFPSDLKYTHEHEWIKLEGDTALVGITDFAQSELSDVVFVDVSSTGKSLSKDEVFGSIEAVKTVSDLFSPCAGTIVEFNQALNAQPELVNTDPFGAGWIVKIKPSNPSELDGLMDVDTYKSFVGH